MKAFLTFLFVLTSFAPSLSGQKLAANTPFANKPPLQKERPIAPNIPLATEICTNGVDDDANGLADIKDFTCFFNSIPPDTCFQTKIVWAIYSDRLYWIDLETNNYRSTAFSPWRGYFDIAWTPNGKLYAVDGYNRKIFEIDPYTAQAQERFELTDYLGSNGMTSDASGNLYLASKTAASWHIVKIDLTSGQVTFIADLTAHNLESAGDLVFVNGVLYASCDNNKIAKIDVHTGTVQGFNVNGPYANGWGMTTLGDGYLYVSANDRLHRIDPVTMVSTLYHVFPTFGGVDGLTSYSEFCNAPGCRAVVSITIESNTPYCTQTGVLLKGTGRGVPSSGTYTWKLPNGQTKNGDTLTAFTSGTYTLRYHGLPDTCGAEESINLTLTNSPLTDLGTDKLMCAGSNQVLLQPIDTVGITGHLWQDGSTGFQYTATQPGLYWLQMSNACGVSVDSIQVVAGTLPNVFLGEDPLLCPNKSISLSNRFPQQPGETYLWSGNQITTNISAAQPGTYWLKVTNACGATTDSLIILEKDSCTCDPFYPQVSLGLDQEICEFDSKVLTNSQHINRFRYTWQDGTKGNTYTVTQPGTYWVEVATHCGTTRDTVTVRKKTEECNCTAYFPTAFTPTINGLNDVYRPWSNCLISGEMSIYNRWGNMVYSTTNLQNGWDGLHKGISQPSGVYAYVIRYKFANRNAVSVKKGTFLLMQ